MSNVIVAFTGFKGVGKSTIARELRDNWPAPTEPIIRSFADGVREVAESITGIRHYKWKREGVKSKTIEPFGMDGREFLQRVGMMAREKIGEDVWVRALESSIDEHATIVDDLRFPNEAEWVKSHHNGIVVGLTRDDVSLDDDHESETEMADHWDEMTDVTVRLEKGEPEEGVKDVKSIFRDCGIKRTYGEW